jgi:hypothetical protein
VRRSVGSFDDAEDVAFLHDEQLLINDLDLGAGPLPEENMVAGPDVEWGELAGFVATTGRTDPAGKGIEREGLFSMT